MSSVSACLAQGLAQSFADDVHVAGKDSGYASDGYDSDATLDPEDLAYLGDRYLSGVPLQRMGNFELQPGFDAWDDYDSEEEDVDADYSPPFAPLPAQSCGDDELAAASEVISGDDFLAVVDDILAGGPSSEPISEDASGMLYASSAGAKPYLIKRFPAHAPELDVLAALNDDELRRDPWNPAPHTHHAVLRGDAAFVALQPLCAHDAAPLHTVLDRLELVRQVLEGMVFMHEQNITGLAFLAHPGALRGRLMMHAPASAHTLDRRAAPVRYYAVDLSGAREACVCTCDEDGEPDSPATPTLARPYPAHRPVHAHDHPRDEPRMRACPFRRDVQAGGLLLHRMFAAAPGMEDAVAAVAWPMRCGEVSAEGARRMLERLRASFDAATLDTNVPDVAGG